MRHIALTLGILGGLFWISLAFFPPACAPVTELSEDFCNRLWTPALASMLIGFSGLYRLMSPSFTKAARVGFISLVTGYALMVIGNFTEYWLLYDLPHQGPNGFARGLAWMTVLLGLLLVLVGALVAGMAMLRAGRIPKWLSLCFLLPLPLTIAIGFLAPNGLGIPMGGLSVAAGGFGLLRAYSRSGSKEIRDNS